MSLEEHNPSQALLWLGRVSDWTFRTWGMASHVYLLLGQYNLALEAAERSLAELPLKHPNCGRAANTLGQIYYELGDIGAAITSLLSAILLLDETKDLIGYARACNNLAVAYFDDKTSSENIDESDRELKENRTHRTLEIRDLLHRARDIQERAGDEMGLAVTHRNLAWFARHFPDLQ